MDVLVMNDELIKNQTDGLNHTLVVASSNQHKLAEVREILHSCALDYAHQMDGKQCDGYVMLSELVVAPLRQFGEADEPVEDGDTFEENARIKARAAYKFLRAQGVSLPVLADDSGLEIDALGGAPGVLSARYAGVHGDDAANNTKVLQELERLHALSLERRRARFVCALCYIDSDGNELVVRGTVEGRIGEREQGSQGFGYDPLFISDEYAPRSLAEVSAVEKHRVSHRGNALRKLAKQLLS